MVLIIHLDFGIVFLGVILLALLAYVVYLHIRLREAALFRQIVDIIPESMFVLDSNKRIIGIHNVNPVAMAGYKVSDIVGNHLSVYSEDKDSPFYQACSLLDKSYDFVYKTGIPDHFDYMIGDAYLEATIKKLGDDKVICMVRDASSLVQELQRFKQEAALAMEAGKLTTWSYDVQSRMFSSLYENFVIGKEMSYEELMDLILVESQPCVEENLTRLINGEVEHIRMDVLVNEKKAGNVICNRVEAIGVKDINGQVRVLYGSQKNVTQELEAEKEKERNRKEMEKALFMRAKAEEANRMKSAFLANMSHEIRTPLNAIVGFSDLIAESEDKEGIDEYVRIIHDNNELLLNLINDVLDLSRIEAGRIDFVMTSFDMKELLSNLAQSTQLKAKEGVVVRTNLPEEKIHITTDRIRIAQVVTNFLNNAVKFTTEGFVEVGCERRGAELYIYVMDTGIGIPKEHTTLIFDRFVKLNDFAQGTGLGLSISDTIIQLLDGRIGVDSEPGKGSVFWIAIPFQEASEIAALPIMSSLVGEPVVESLSKRYRILIAEDNQSNYMLYAQLLSAHQLYHAGDGEEAIELFKRERPDIVLLDVKMPKMDGLTAGKIIRELSDDIPIIAVSASILPEEQQKALTIGFTDFLPKPITSKLLMRMLKIYLEP